MNQVSDWRWQRGELLLHGFLGYFNIKTLGPIYTTNRICAWDEPLDPINPTTMFVGHQEPRGLGITNRAWKELQSLYLFFSEGPQYR